jgi:hypothetical protein
VTRIGDELRHRLQTAVGMFDGGGFDEHLAVEVAEHPLGPSFRAIDGDDAEVLWPDVLDPLLDLPPGLADEAFL